MVRTIPAALDEFDGCPAVVSSIPSTPSPSGSCGMDLGRLEAAAVGLHSPGDITHFKKQVPQQLVPLPPALPPQLNCMQPLFSHPPPAPVLHADNLTHAHGIAVPLSLQIKNTFIDGGMKRSASLERLLSNRRQAQSCPGSRLPSPRQVSGQGVKEFEVVSSQASTVDTAEVLTEDSLFECNNDMVNIVPSVQMAAWTTLMIETFPKGWLAVPANVPYDPSGNLHGARDHQIFPMEGHNVIHHVPHLQFDPMSSVPPSYPCTSAAKVLQLEQMLAFGGSTSVESSTSEDQDAPPQLGSAELPSVGSLGHYMHRCKPCAFVTRMGCGNGVQCSFCHLCPAGEKKRRRKEKKSFINAARRLK